MTTQSPLRGSTAAVLLAALGVGCWTTPADDAGDRQWVTFATVTLLGRHPENTHELDVLADLADDQGRAAVVDVLMEQPEYVTHWTRLLMDQLDVAREGAEKVDDTTCFTDKRLATYYYDDLVDHLRFQAWDTAFCPSRGGWIAPRTTLPAAPPVRTTEFTSGSAEEMREQFDRLATPATFARGTQTARLSDAEFMGPNAQAGVPMRGLGYGSRPNNCESFTMADAFAASLTEDRLDALFRVGLVPLATTSQNTGDAASRFLDVYVDRDPGCVECHGTNYSTTNARPGNGDWDRYHPAAMVDLEQSAFSYSDSGGWHDGSLGGTAVGNRITNLFRGDGWRASLGMYPFGIDGSCATEGGRVGFAQGALTSDAALPTAFAGLSGTDKGIGDLVNQFAVGVAALHWDQLEAGSSSIDGNAATGAGAMAACNGCHPALADAPDLAVATKYMSAQRIYDTIVHGSRAGLMQPVGVTDQTARDIAAYLVTLPGHVDPQVYETPAASFAHLAAMAIVNDVHRTVTGADLILAHGGPRNEDAAATLDHLTRVFVDEGWSLKALLREMLTHQLANRRAPADSAYSLYELPMLFQPWADIGPGTTQFGEDVNGQGDVVHRWPVPTLGLTLEHALLWPEPPMFPSSSSGTWFDLPFQQEFGGMTGETFTGFDALTTGAMLAWEREVGTCEHPGATADYVDLVTSAGEALTVEEAMLLVKERLLTETRWWGDPFSTGGIVGPDGPQDERTLAGQLASGAGTSLASPASDPGGEQAVRDYCGSLLMSPDFLMAGLPAWDGATPPPALDGPCVGDACTYSALCEKYEPTATALGYDMSCGIGGFTW
ncbi:MAG: c-type cytochrome [Myxococcota bacterium]